MVKELNPRFYKLVYKFPNDIKPKVGGVLSYKSNAFEGTFGLNLRDKKPNDFKLA